MNTLPNRNVEMSIVHELVQVERDNKLTNMVKTHYEDLRNHELTIGITITRDKRYGQVLRKQRPDYVYIKDGKTITLRSRWALYDVDFLLNVQTFVKVIENA